MATSILQSDQLTAFAGIRQPSAANGNCIGYYDKKGDMVRMTFSASNSSPIPMNTPIYKIASPYKPNRETYGVLVAVGDTIQLAGRFAVNSNGEVFQQLTNNAKTFFGYIEYKVGGVILSICNAFRTLTPGREVA